MQRSRKTLTQAAIRALRLPDVPLSSTGLRNLIAQGAVVVVVSKRRDVVTFAPPADALFLPDYGRRKVAAALLRPVGDLVPLVPAAPKSKAPRRRK